MKGNNLHIYYPSTFRFESRILKETKSILDFELADNVFIAAYWEEGLPEEEFLGEKRFIKRFRAKFFERHRSSYLKPIKFLSIILSTIRYYRKKNITIVNCHSLYVLPIGIIFKLLWRSKVIYDAHELETEKNGLNGVKKKISKMMEWFFIRFVDHTIVVGDSIEEWYKKKYNLRDKISVIKNMPYRIGDMPPSGLLRNEFNIPSDHIIFLYQGLISHGRGINKLLASFMEVEPSKHIVFMGYGELTEEVQTAAERYTNIHYKPAVPPDKILSYTSSADIGVVLLERTCLSYYYCMPNKFFEYIMAEIPLYVNDWPDMANWIKKYDIGRCIDASKENIITAIKSTTYEDTRKFKSSVKLAKENVGWEIEEKKLVDIYKSLNN